MKQPLTAEEVGRLLALDADTVGRLGRHLDLLRQWQPRVNLVGAGTLADPWRRHVLDSAQLLPLLPAGAPRLIDLGSGAGFPGLVLAIAGSAEVTLVDADARKCVFLAEAARVTGTRVRILNARIDSLAPGRFDIVTARALAPLPRLIAAARPLLAPGGFLLVLKGRGFARELTAAADKWKMRIATWPSRTDAEGVIARIDDIRERAAHCGRQREDK